MAIPHPFTLAVITGGHSYDVVNFQRLFRRFPEADVYLQNMDDFASSSTAERQTYDVVLFYTMLMDGPSDQSDRWYAGKPRTALEELGATAQGIFLLHHAILAYPQYALWSDLVGIENRAFGYHPGQRLRIDIARPDHPITDGLESWEMTDETYTMPDAGAGSDILLTANHPKSMKTIAWTRQFRESRVFCFASGHDNETWSNHNFTEVLRRGLLWCAGRI